MNLSFQQQLRHDWLDLKNKKKTAEKRIAQLDATWTRVRGLANRSIPPTPPVNQVDFNSIQNIRVAATSFPVAWFIDVSKFPFFFSLSLSFVLSLSASLVYQFRLWQYRNFSLSLPAFHSALILFLSPFSLLMASPSSSPSWFYVSCSIGFPLHSPELP